jgi:hypothetical protein
MALAPVPDDMRDGHLAAAVEEKEVVGGGVW